jgi:hypothetical protein
MLAPSSDWVPSRQDVDMQRRIDWQRMRTGVDLAAKASGFGECSQDCNQGRDCDCDDGPRPVNKRYLLGTFGFTLLAWAAIIGWLWHVSGRTL